MTFKQIQFNNEGVAMLPVDDNHKIRVAKTSEGYSVLEMEKMDPLGSMAWWEPVGPNIPCASKQKAISQINKIVKKYNQES